MSIVTELAALKDHLAQATTSANLTAAYTIAIAAGADITQPNPARGAAVLNREVTDFWPGPYPLVEVMFLDRNVGAPVSNSSGVGSMSMPMVQTFVKPNSYSIRIRSQSDTDNAFTVNNAETELFMVAEAIEVWFASLTHRCLPTSGGAARVKYAGPPFNWRANPLGPYQTTDGALGQVLAGRLTVLGLPRPTTT